MQILIMLAVVLLVGKAHGTGIIFEFANSEITSDAGELYYEYDILASVTQAGTYHDLLQMWINYNTLAFGESIQSNNNLTVTRGPLLTSAYLLTIVNVTESEFAINTELDANPPVEMPTTPTQLVHVKMKIQNVGYTTGIVFQDDWMVGEQYEINSVPYEGPTIVNNLDETLPIELSSFTATLSNVNLVTLQWVTQSETNVSGYRIYRNTEADAASASMLNIFIPGTNTSQMQVYVFTDEEVTQDGTYYYWLENLDMDGSSTLHGPISISVSFANTGSPSIPIQPGIHKVYPNPFHPVANLSLSVEKSAWVELDIYNLKGQKVRSVYSGNMDKGSKTLTWDGKDSFGKICANGMYLATMRCDGKAISQTKLILAK